ncbi:MAG: TetR/AcrR family transcriptional regulator [Bacteroidales bacterium]|nr:TetR/AcrR family transcriptional regulator [Bacteroidales bacterium]
MENEMIKERNRESTEKRLLDTVGEIIATEGFEKLGINAVAARSDVSKILIYRYFGSIEGLMTTYMRRNDFWLNFPQSFPEKAQMPLFVKQIFYSQIEQLKNNVTLRKLYRWELSCNNAMIVDLRKQRERVGVDIISKVSNITGYPEKEIAALASIVSASITYLVMLGDSCDVYNGIAINSDSGWNQIKEGIDLLVDKFFEKE